MGCGISRFVPRQDIHGRGAPQLCTRSGEYDHDHDDDDDDDNNPNTVITKKNNADLPSDVDHHVPSTSFHTPQLQTTSPDNNNNNNNNNNIVQRRKQSSAEATSYHYNDNDGASAPMFMGSPSFREYCVAGDVACASNHRKEMMSGEKGKKMMQREDSNIS